MIERLQDRNPKLARHFGESFLKKIVQITVTIPKPTLPALTQLLSSVTGNKPPTDTAKSVAHYDESSVAEAVTELKGEHLRNPSDVEQRSIKVREQLPGIPPEAVREAVRRVRSTLLNTDSDDVARAEFALLEYLPRNPRTVKRFDNASRLQLLVANNTPGCELDFRYEEIEALGRWVAMHLGWPTLPSAIEDNPALLGQLDLAANGQPTAVADDVKEWMAKPSLMALLNTKVSAVRVSSLPLESFVNTFPEASHFSQEGIPQTLPRRKAQLQAARLLTELRGWRWMTAPMLPRSMLPKLSGQCSIISSAAPGEFLFQTLFICTILRL